MEFIKTSYDEYEGEVVHEINPDYDELMEAYAKARLKEIGEVINKDTLKHMLSVIDNELEARGYDLDKEDIEPLYDLVLSYLED